MSAAFKSQIFSDLLAASFVCSRLLRLFQKLNVNHRATRIIWQSACSGIFSPPAPPDPNTDNNDADRNDHHTQQQSPHLTGGEIQVLERRRFGTNRNETLV